MQIMAAFFSYFIVVNYDCFFLSIHSSSVQDLAYANL